MDVACHIEAESGNISRATLKVWNHDLSLMDDSAFGRSNRNVQLVWRR